MQVDWDLAPRATVGHARPAHLQRDAVGVVVHQRPLVELTVAPGEIAVIRGVDYDRIIGQSPILEGLEDLLELVIDQRDEPQYFARASAQRSQSKPVTPR